MSLYIRSKTKPSCPRHGSPLFYIQGRYGGFYACGRYEIDCDITANKSKFDNHFHMTDQVTRDARKAAHAAFDPLWKTQNNPLRCHSQMSRKAAYHWLAEVLGTKRCDCHIQHFDAETCERVLAAVIELRRAVTT